MSKAVAKGKNTEASLICLFMKALMYLCAFLAFYLPLSVTNPQLMRVSRTSAIVIFSFLIVGYFMMRTYGGYAVGKDKSSHIVYSLVFGLWLTDAVSYFVLLMMNVNEINRSTITPVSGEIPLLFAAMAAQLILTVLFVCLGNYIYFRLVPPAETLIITSSRKSLLEVLPRVITMKRQYRIAAMADYRRSDIKELIKRESAVMFYDVPPDKRLELEEYAYKEDKAFYVASEIFDVVENAAVPVTFGDCSFLECGQKGRLKPEQRFLKRLMDIVFSLAFMPLFLIIMLPCAAAVKLCDGGKCFYRQKRATKGGRVFEIIKLRTMREDSPDHISLASEDDERITSVGRFLRRYRLDELPQIFNVLKGDMSLVGPRPEIPDMIDTAVQSFPEFGYRLCMKAGLTGYAQITGRYDTDSKRKALMDIYYIENYSLWWDVKILLRTITIILRPESAKGKSEAPSGEALALAGSYMDFAKEGSD
ncbi:MAG: sugar transferase [Eubacteriales bacterium]|nr:sugar transferase [Eubacteriales bacterium]MDD4512763.1 sugar transferase [Eubacteriales bacterium]